MTDDEAEALTILAKGGDPRLPRLEGALLLLELAGLVRPALGSEPPSLTALGREELDISRSWRPRLVHSTDAPSP